MLKITEYKGDLYKYRDKSGNRWSDEYIRFDWNTGFLEMKKYFWDKLSKRKKNLIYKKGLEA